MEQINEDAAARPLFDESAQDRETWYTPDRCKKLLKLMPYHLDGAPRLRWFDDLLVPAHAYRNPNEWWWQVRGDLLWALDRVSSLGRELVESCILSGETQESAGARLGIHQSNVSKTLKRTYEDMAFRLGYVPDEDERR